MCGIGGILRIVKPGEAGYVDPAELDARLRIEADPRKNPSAWLIPEEWLDAIDREIAWRGPDGQGRFRDRVVRAEGTIVEVALVHRRLAIIDLECGGQPMMVDGCPACAREAENRREQDRAAHKKKDAAPSDEVVSSSGYLLYDPSSDEPIELRAGTPHLAAVVFNGCIYNHRELRRELEEKGHEFRTDHSDTEVVLHRYLDSPDRFSTEGLSAPNLPWSPSDLGVVIDGMYAFAIWDRSAARLALARDDAGEKPLFVTSGFEPGLLIFSSAAAAIPSAASLGLPRRAQWFIRPAVPMRDAVADWVSLGFAERALPDERGVPMRCGSVLIDRIFRSGREDGGATVLGCVGGFIVLTILLAVAVALLIAGRYLLGLLVASGGFWFLFKLPLPFLATAVYKRTLRPIPAPPLEGLSEAVSDAVLARLDSDVPLGCFLSGGVDSSLIAHHAKQHLGELTTLTVRMPSESHDESRWARLVADHLGTRHVEVECDGAHAAEDLVRIVETMGLPFGDSSILPMYWLCREARNHVKVALAGDGGDELFYGYERYRAMRWLSLTRWALMFYPTGRLDRSDARSRDDKMARLVAAARHTGYTDLLAIFPTPDRRELIGRDAGHWCRRRVFGGMSAARREDLHHYLPGDLLRKVDTASMMCGVEVRCPYLSWRVIEIAGATPPRVHTNGGETKHLLKELVRRHLPREIADRPKQGFAIPISDWLRTDFGGLRTLLLDSLAGERPFGRVHDVLPINMAFVRRMLDEHWAAGGLTPIHTSRAVRKRDHGQRLFALVSLAIWARQEAARHGEHGEPGGRREDED